MYLGVRLSAERLKGTHSGIRIGTPAITTRGFKQAEAKQVATWICDILDDIDNEEVILVVREKVSKLCAEFPVYG